MSKQHRITIQYPDDIVDTTLPPIADLQQWICMALQSQTTPVELTLRFVDHTESAELNATFRGKATPTNVLSFPMHEMLEDGYCLLGDLAICVPLIKQEADAQHKTLHAHCAHLVIHGCLHLIGFDHETDADALKMESLEIALLNKCNINNPYEISTQQRSEH